MPHSPLHPVISASDLLVDLTYTFYAGAPYFTKHGRMEAVQDFSLNYLRDDEWVFSGYCFDELLWMGEDGTVREGPVAPEAADRIKTAVGMAVSYAPALPHARNAAAPCGSWPGCPRRHHQPPRSTGVQRPPRVRRSASSVCRCAGPPARLWRSPGSGQGW